jgi:putative oxidoreductase
VIQRLFSSFPDSWPGVGLLLLRLATGVPFVVNGTWALSFGQESGGVIFAMTELSCGSLILVGLWTPVAAVAQALLQGAIVFTKHYDLLHMAGGVIGLSLALLGPGAWSIDARLYGRRRIRV